MRNWPALPLGGDVLSIVAMMRLRSDESPGPGVTQEGLGLWCLRLTTGGSLASLPGDTFS